MKNTEESGSELFVSFMRFRRGYKHQIMENGMRLSDATIMRILIHSSHHGVNEMNPSQISSIMGIQQPTLSPILRNLEKDGLIIRRHSEEDRRMTYISPTEKAILQHEAHMKRCNDIFKGLEEYLGAGDSQKFVEIMSRAAEYMLSLAPDDEGRQCP